MKMFNPLFIELPKTCKQCGSAIPDGKGNLCSRCKLLRKKGR